MSTWLSWIFQVDLPRGLSIWVTNHVVQNTRILKLKDSTRNRRSSFFNAVRCVKLSKISIKLQFCWCWLLPSHFLVCPLRYSLDLKFKCRISGISNVIRTENSLLLFSLLHFTLEKFAFFSSFPLIYLILLWGLIPLSSCIATGCQAVITVTSSLPTTPSGPVLCRGC